jgi:hypothetical protein
MREELKEKKKNKNPPQNRVKYKYAYWLLKYKTVNILFVGNEISVISAAESGVNNNRSFFAEVQSYSGMVLELYINRLSVLRTPPPLFIGLDIHPFLNILW